MATKAQLEAELAELKKELGSRNRDATDAPEPDPGARAPDREAGTRSRITEMLTEQGIDPSEIESLWSGFSRELEDLSREKPLVTTAAAFALGFSLGRLTKS